jgi:hypothetical protein
MLFPQTHPSSQAQQFSPHPDQQDNARTYALQEKTSRPPHQDRLHVRVSWVEREGIGWYRLYPVEDYVVRRWYNLVILHTRNQNEATRSGSGGRGLKATFAHEDIAIKFKPAEDTPFMAQLSTARQHWL